MPPCRAASHRYVYHTYIVDTITGRLNFRLTEDQERALRRAARVAEELDQ